MIGGCYHGGSRVHSFFLLLISGAIWTCARSPRGTSGTVVNTTAQYAQCNITVLAVRMQHAEIYSFCQRVCLFVLPALEARGRIDTVGVVHATSAAGPPAQSEGKKTETCDRFTLSVRVSH